MVASPQDAAAYIKSQFSFSGEVQMQKLVYYSQAWHMVWNGRPLFKEPIEAWVMGPVVRSLRYTAAAKPTAFDLTEDEKQSIEAVIRHYGVHYGWTLSEQTHQELPWVQTRGELPAGAHSDREIPRRLIRSYYTEQSMRGEGPTRASSEPVHVNDDELVAVARRNQARWADALALLAQ